jgi:predicted nucleotidyltransferase
MTDLKKIIDIIVEAVSPDKIILFGSRARGDYRENSDYDILIFKECDNRLELAGDLHILFGENKFNVPIDVLITNDKLYNKYKTNNGFIYKTIEKEGKLVWKHTQYG